MKCVDALSVLEQLAAGTASSEQGFSVLRAEGLIETVAPVAQTPLDDQRELLQKAQGHRLELRERIAQAADEAEVTRLKADLATLETKIRALRVHILEITEQQSVAEGAVQVGLRGWTLTWKGRELLEELSARRARLGETTLAQFQTEIQKVRSALADVARRAAVILKAISHKSADIDQAKGLPVADEVYARAAAVGLGGAAGDPLVLAERWLKLYQGLERRVPPTMAAVAAEALATHTRPVQEFGGLLTQLGATPAKATDDQTLCAILCWTEPDMETTIACANVLSSAFGDGPRAPAFLLASAECEPSDVVRVKAIEAAIAAEAGSDARMVACFLAISGDERAVERFSVRLAWLKRFSPDGMAITAAMLGLIDAEPVEVLDNLRLTASAIHDAKLSVGPVENMGLAAKLLLSLAIRSGFSLLPQASSKSGSIGAPGLSGSLPVPRLPPAALPAVATFHTASIHRWSWWAAHHVAHGHGGYG